jgi:hypothetical protein
MPTENPCVQCGHPIDHTNLTFEQRLIDDKDFCIRCWNEIMNDNTDEVKIVLPVIR